MKKKSKPNLTELLSDTAGSTRTAAKKPPPTQAPAPTPKAKTAPSRENTRPITGHFPQEVRDQLKILAIQTNQTMHSLMAEAFNDLFSKYGRPEIAPTKPSK